MTFDIMKVSANMLLFLLTLALFSCASTQPDTKEKNTPAVVTAPLKKSLEDVKSSITSLINDTVLSSTFIGISIISLEDSALLYEYNSKKLFHPASAMKLLTTATALHNFATDFKFSTSIAHDGSIQESILNGNLWIIGSGDPLLTDKDLDSLVMAIESNGIKSITGELIGDISRFDTIAWGKGWMWDDEPFSDFPFITPLTVNHNSVKVKVARGLQSGHEPDIFLSPSTDMLMVFNEAVTSSDTLIQPLAVTRQHGTNRFTVSGRISPGDTSLEFTRTVWRPEIFFLSLLKDKLLARNIRFSGNLYTVSTTQPSITKLGSVHHDLDTVLQQINKHSDNLAAENLLKTLSAITSDTSGSAEHGLSIIRDYLVQAGIDTVNLILADGSGVSWYTALSPNLLTQLLQFEYTQTTTFPVFLNSLSVAGIDGTLKNRLKGTRAEGNLRGKTGTLTGVSTLSGYVTTADGKSLAFSIMGNHFPGQLAALRNLQNAIITLLTELNLTSQ